MRADVQVGLRPGPRHRAVRRRLAVVRPGLVRPGLVRSGLVRPGLVRPGLVRPAGLVAAASLCLVGADVLVAGPASEATGAPARVVVAARDAGPSSALSGPVPLRVRP